MVKNERTTMTTKQVNFEIEAHQANCFVDIMDEDYGCKYGPDSECPANFYKEIIEEGNDNVN